MMRLGGLGAAALLAAGSVFAEAPPHWSFEIKGGRYTPDTEDWSQAFHHESVTYFEAGLAYKPARQWEVAVNLGYLDTDGEAFAPEHNAFAGDVRYELFPFHVAVVWRGVFNEDQIFVPYVGGGWTRIGYRQKIEHQSERTGSGDGYHLRGGVQWLLDGLDPRSADALHESVGVTNSYLILEAQRTDVSKAGVQLGGSAVLLGLLLEF